MALLYGYEAYPDRTVITRLSKAVRLEDEYTEKPPVGQVEVLLAAQGVKAVRNPSGYYLFTDLPAGVGDLGLRVEAEHYFAVNTTADLSEPVVEITLKPAPSYPFPPGATLIRGIFLDTAGNPLPDARVEVLETNINTITTRRGEFVLYFKGLTVDDVFVENGKRYVQGKPGKTFHLEIVKEPDTWTYNWEIGAVEGMTTALKEPITLS